MTRPIATATSQGGTPEVSVIIVNWNTRDILADCLRSIQKETQADAEIIVIDNASSDDSAGMMRREFPNVILIANTDNRGFAGANNQGLAIARGKRILLLNPDTIILDRAIDKSIAWLDAHPDVGCMGCQILERPGQTQITSFSDPTLLNQTIIELGLGRLGRFWPRLALPFYTGWQRDSLKEVDVVSGMFMLVPRAVLEKVGPLDPGFFIYAEEADWCRRIRNAGYRCVYAPIAQIIHLDGGSKSSSQVRSRMYVQQQKSLVYYTRKHQGALAGFLAKAMYAATSFLRLVAFGGLFLLRRDIESRARVRLSLAALAFHLMGREPRR